jgi:hypothetical protein
MSDVKANPFDDLVGLDVATVTFVRDYVQIGFDGPLLTCFFPPRIVLPTEGAFAFGKAGYADALVEFINCKLCIGVVIPRKEIKLTFEAGYGLSIDLNPDTAPPGPESAMLKLEDGRWWVWRPTDK